MPKAVGIDLGTTNSVVSVLEAGDPVVIPNARARAPPRRWSPSPRPARCSSARSPSARRSPTPTARSARSSATWARAGVDRHRRQDVHAAGDQRPHADEAEARRRGLPRRHRHPGGHHRARVLRRRPAHRHQGGGPDRRPRGAADHQRADRGRPGLRPRQGGRRPDGPRVRPRRRHVRRVGPRDRRRRVRGQEHPRRHPARRRRLGPAGHRLAGRAVQGRPTASTCRRTRWPCSASRRRPRRPRSSSARCSRRRSTCRSSPPPPRARCTSTRS